MNSESSAARAVFVPSSPSALVEISGTRTVWPSSERSSWVATVRSERVSTSKTTTRLPLRPVVSTFRSTVAEPSAASATNVLVAEAARPSSPLVSPSSVPSAETTWAVAFSTYSEPARRPS